jgi:type II secretory pathway pseudopilin PulG
MKSSLYNREDRRALTLIEMLIGMAITLVMMAAVVQLFANISQGVRNRRATMEVSAKLRTARAQLYNDLAGATCLKYPKDTHAVMPKPDSNNPPDGYFEIVEGERADENPASGGSFDQATSMIPSTGRLYDADGQPLNASIVTDGGGLGDYDDFLAMTVESQTERFRGRGRGLRPGGNPNVAADWVDMAISSPVAEVVWFATQNPPDRSEGEPGMRKVYRRVVLITPWYGTETKNLGAGPVTGSDPLLDLVNLGITDFQNQLIALKQFQARYDISVRLENGKLVPNTLADLARREHRFAHAPNFTSGIPNIAHFPHQFPYEVDAPNIYEDPDEGDSSLQPLGDIEFLPQVFPAPYHQAYFADATGERKAEDLILDEVLAFDVHVFDPGAPLYNYQGTVVNPSSSNAFRAAVATGPANITGFGAYVDLGWNNGPPSGNPPAYTPDYIYNHPTILALIPNPPAPLFQQERRLGWHPTFPNYVRGSSGGIPCVYDTWTTHYETDQSNQEEAPFYSITDPDVNRASQIPWNPGQLGVIDQGANGLDDIVAQDEIALGSALNGPDDPLERETSPPYPYPLYGVQVKIRLYEAESRQIRETSVTRNLAK